MFFIGGGADNENVSVGAVCTSSYLLAHLRISRPKTALARVAGADFTCAQLHRPDQSTNHTNFNSNFNSNSRRHRFMATRQARRQAGPSLARVAPASRPSAASIRPA